MARPLRIEFPGALYHVTARGNARQDIYLTDDDRRNFLAILKKAVERNDWLCHAYCLMSNHYHLLIEIGNPGLSKGMKYLNGVYSQYFNRQHDRVGHLFQGRYKAILVEKDSYLQELSRYIVLNPVRAAMVRSAKDWPWSSYRVTAGMSKDPGCLVVDNLLASFGGRRGKAQDTYKRFVSEGRGQPSPWYGLKNQIYLGSEEFVEDMQCQLDKDQSLEDIPKLQKGRVKKPLSYWDDKGNTRNERMAMAYLSGCYTLYEIGDYFGVSYATVSRAVKAYECARRKASYLISATGIYSISGSTAG